jgi:hypothetical protein
MDADDIQFVEAITEKGCPESVAVAVADMTFLPG